MMMLKSLNRSQRTKGLRTKCVFQAFLVIALCIWLLYEVKHTYYVKKENFKGNKEASEVVMLRGIEAVRLGRKDLDPHESSRLNVKGSELTEEEEEETVKQEEGEAEDAEQSVEDSIDEDDREKENEIEDSGNVDLDDQVGDEEERTPDGWEENYKNNDGSGSAED